MKAGHLLSLWRAVGWSGVLAVAVFSLIPVPPEAVDAAGGDKLLHLAGYAALAAWFAQLRPPAGVGRWHVALWLTILGAVLELAQAAVPWRSTEGWDLLADAGGAMLGVALAGRHGLRVLDRIRHPAG